MASGIKSTAVACVTQNPMPRAARVVMRPPVPATGNLRVPRGVSLPLAVDPARPAQITADTQLRLADGTTAQVAAGTACFARYRTTQHQVYVETCAPPKSGWWWTRRAPDAQFDIDKTGLVAEDVVDMTPDTECTAVPVHTPLFAHPPCCNDIIECDGASCSLTAAALALTYRSPQAILDMMRDNHDGTVTVRLFQKTSEDASVPVYYRINKSIPPWDGWSQQKQAALWWQLLVKAVAVHGWECPAEDNAQPIITHAQRAPGGYCYDFMTLLTGAPAYAYYLDIDNAANTLVSLFNVGDIHSNTAELFRFTVDQAHAYDHFVAHHPTFHYDLAKFALTPEATDIKSLGLFLQGAGIDPILSGKLQQATAITMQQTHAHDGAYSAVENFLAFTIDHKLRAGQLVGFSTRRVLPRKLEPSFSARINDLLVPFSDASYAGNLSTRRVLNGILSEHCYAITGIRHNGTRTEVEVFEPTAMYGRRYTIRNGVRIAFASNERHFWFDLRDLYRYSIALYFSR